MRQKLVIHAGGNKTGSSAIQRFLSLNGPSLASSGVAVPSSELTPTQTPAGNHVFVFEKLFRDPEGRQRLEEAVRLVGRQQPGVHTIVLSAENLAANPAAPPLFAGLAQELDLRLVMYIRRQDDYLLSSWQQWYSKVREDFWAWAVQEVGRMGDWDAYLQQWEAVLPSDHITVRVYERSRLVGGDVVTDFSDWLGLPEPPGGWRRPEEAVNVSVSDAVMELVQGNPHIFQNAHDADFYNTVLALTGDTYVKKSRHSSITLAQRMSIIQRYASGNRRIRERYRPDSPGLFTMPKEGDYDYLTPDRKREEQLRFLTTMLWTMRGDRKKP